MRQFLLLMRKVPQQQDHCLEIALQQSDPPLSQPDLSQFLPEGSEVDIFSFYHNVLLCSSRETRMQPCKEHQTVYSVLRKALSKKMFTLESIHSSLPESIHKPYLLSRMKTKTP